MSDAMKRSIRGLFQIAFPEAILRVLEAFNVITLTEDQHVTLLAVLMFAVTFVQNWLEDNTAVPALLKPEVKS